MSIEAEQLAAYIDGRLEPGERALVERHLADCAECRDIVGDGIPMDVEVPATVTPFVPAPKQKTRWIGWTASGLAAAAAVALVVRVSMPDRSDTALAQLRNAAGHTRPFEARLTGGFAYRPVESVTRSAEQARTSTDLRIAAASVEKQAQASPTADNLHALGDAQMLTRELDDAIRSLEQASRLAPTDGRIRVDLAAAYVARARQQNASADATLALDALDKAGDQSTSLEVSFNRALALEMLGRRSDARAAWQRYLASDAQSGWAAEARSHLAALDSLDNHGR